MYWAYFEGITSSNSITRKNRHNFCTLLAGVVVNLGAISRIVEFQKYWLWHWHIVIQHKSKGTKKINTLSLIGISFVNILSRARNIRADIDARVLRYAQADGAPVEVGTSFGLGRHIAVEQSGQERHGHVGLTRGLVH